MRKTGLLLLAILLLSGVFMPTQIGEAQDREVYATPQAMLQAYYNAINLGDYVTAYGLHLSLSQTPDEFSAGFQRTIAVTPYFGVFDMDTTPISGRVQAVLVSQEVDYSTVRGYNFSTYAGCFWVERTTAGNTWTIRSADLAVVVNHGERPANATINDLLNRYCTDNLNTVSIATVAYTPQAEMLQNYFMSINTTNYSNAYASWLEPLPGPLPNGGPSTDYRQPFDQFAAGYANTQYINVYTGLYDEAGASAGKSYLNGLMPVVLIGQTNDNQFDVYAGCYVIGFKADGSYGIVNGQVFSIDNNVPLGYDILEYLNTSCVELAIPN